MKSSFIAIAACLVASPALAQVADNSNERTERDTIIVTGQQLEKETEVSGRLGLSIRETPAVVDIVTQQDFQLQGVRNAIEAPAAAAGAHPAMIALEWNGGIDR